MLASLSKSHQQPGARRPSTAGATLIAVLVMQLKDAFVARVWECHARCNIFVL
jgi:hypothetical protein